MRTKWSIQVSITTGRYQNLFAASYS